MDILWAISNMRTEWLTSLMRIIQYLGETSVLLVVMCIIYWTINKDLAYRVGFSFFVSGIAVQLAKVVFMVPRPWVRDPSFKPVESAIETATGYSFPSGHTQSAMALFGTIALSVKKLWVRILLFIGITLLGFSRMYMGVHYLSDVLTAYIFTFIIVLLVDRASSTDRKEVDLRRALLLAAAALGATAYTCILHANGTVEVKYATDMCKMAGGAVGFAAAFFIERNYIDFSTGCDRLWQHILKVAAGLAVVLALKSGLKVVLGSSPLGSFARYLLMILWAMLLYPLILKRLQNRKAEKK